MQLILRTTASPYNDINKGSVLSQEELDLNQINLKGEIIYTADTENNTIIFKKINGDEIVVPINPEVDQNNLVKAKYIGIYNKNQKPQAGPTSLTELFNNTSIYVEDDEIWLLYVIEGVTEIVFDPNLNQLTPITRFYLQKYLFGKGKGVYDPIPSFLDDDIFLITETQPLQQDINIITQGANTQTFDLGDITGEGDFWGYVNQNGPYDMTDSDKEYLFLLIQDDVTYLYLFIGEFGNYGAGELQTNEVDYLLVTSSEVTVNSIIPTWQQTIDEDRNADRATLYHVAYSGGLFGGYAGAGPTVIQQDPISGRIYYYGFFTIFNGVVKNHLVALNPDGSIDESFVTNGVNSTPFQSTNFAIQPDGKLILSGNFTQYYSLSNNILNDSIIPILKSNTTVGLASAGTNNSDAWNVFDKNVATSWTSTAGLGTTAWVSYRLITPKIAKRYYLLRPSVIQLRPTGWFFQGSNDNSNWDTLETVTGNNDFTYLSGVLPNTTAYLYYRILVNTVQTGSNARIFQFDISESDTITSIVDANRIIRLNPDGSVDNTFNYGSGFNAFTIDAVLDNNSKIYVGGIFNSYSGETNLNQIVRLNSDGSRDLTFDQGSGFNDTVTDIKVDSSNNIYVVGYFNSYSGETNNNRIIKIFENGNKDTSFVTGTGFNSSTNQPIQIYLTSDNKVFVIGYFTLYNGTTVNKMVKLNLDGSIDTSFQSQGTGFNGTFLEQFFEYDGNYVLVGDFTNYDGIQSNNTIILDTSGNIVRKFPLNTRIREILNDGSPIGINWNGTAFNVGVVEDNYLINTKRFNYNETNGKATYEVGGLFSIDAQEIMPKILIEELILQNSKDLQTLFEESAVQNNDYAFIQLNNSDFFGVNFEKGNTSVLIEGDNVGVYSGTSNSIMGVDGFKSFYKDDPFKALPQYSHLDSFGNITWYYSVFIGPNEFPLSKKLEMGEGIGVLRLPDVSGNDTLTLATEEWVKEHKSFINYFEFSGDAVTNIAVSDTWYKLTTSGTTSLFSRGQLEHTNNRVTNTGDTKVFKMEGIISISSGNNNEIHAAFFKNDELYPCSEQSMLLSGSGKSSALPFHCVIELQNNDYIEVWVKNASGTTNITLSNVNVIITEM